MPALPKAAWVRLNLLPPALPKAAWVEEDLCLPALPKAAWATEGCWGISSAVPKAPWRRSFRLCRRLRVLPVRGKAWWLMWRLVVHAVVGKAL